MSAASESLLEWALILNQRPLEAREAARLVVELQRASADLERHEHLASAVGRADGHGNLDLDLEDAWDAFTAAEGDR